MNEVEAMSLVMVIKKDHAGREVWRYTGRLLERAEARIVLEARFDREDVPFHGLTLRRGDRFVETFYSDRWYNVFEVHDRDDDRLKGWYCNVGRPAEIRDGVVSYEDLALDVLVFPDGRQLVLDEEEFAGLPLSAETRRKALEGLAALQARFRN